jgi:hypothetical protein
MTSMADDRAGDPRPGFAQGLASAGSRAAARTLRPFTNAGIDLERQALDRVLESEELERVLLTTLSSPGFQASLRRALASEGAGELVDTLFETGLFDRIIDRLLVSGALWRLVDEVAASPAVTAAISQQGLGFADQLGSGLRARVRATDVWLERTVQRIVRRGAHTG